MRGLVFGVMLAFAMSGAALARGHGGEGSHESEHSQGEHHHHQPHNERSQRVIILADGQMEYGSVDTD
jgi:hypothetical protein